MDMDLGDPEEGGDETMSADRYILRQNEDGGGENDANDGDQETQERQQLINLALEQAQFQFDREQRMAEIINTATEVSSIRCLCCKF